MNKSIFKAFAAGVLLWHLQSFLSVEDIEPLLNCLPPGQADGAKVVTSFVHNQYGQYGVAYDVVTSVLYKVSDKQVEKACLTESKCCEILR